MAKSVLIAEDEEFLRTIVANKLKKEGFEVIEALDGEDAMSKLKNHAVDLVLLDLMMPKLNGFDVLQNIRADEKLKDLKVIILSNLGQDTDVEKCRALKITDYIVKSDTSIIDIVNKIKQVLT